METDKTNEIFQKILKLSEEKKIKWKSVDNTHTSFSAEINDFKITVGFNTMIYSFNVVSNNGIELAKAVRAIVDRTGNSTLPLKDLYDMARRYALNIDNNINDFLSSLDNL